MAEYRAGQTNPGGSEDLYRSLFENMLNGFAYCRMLFNDGIPQDFIYLAVNDAFMSQTGLKDVVGRKVTEVIPGIRETDPQLFEIYGRVAMTGQPERFEVFVEALQMWFLISVYSPAQEYFVAVFDVITERKRVESVEQAHLRMLTAANKITMTVDEFLQVALDEIEAQTGSTISFYHFLEADQETLSLQNWSTNTLREMCTAEGKGSHYPISKAGVWVDCVHERSPIIHNDFSSLPHRKGLPQGHAPIIREMVVPIMRGNRIVAIIGVGNKLSAYNETDVNIALLLGDFSWEIVERKHAEQALRERTWELQQLSDTLELQVRERTAELGKMNEDLRRISGKLLSAQEEERKKIAGDVHDIIGSCLAGIKYKVEKTLTKVGETSKDVTESLQAVIPMVEEIIGECRRIQQELRPPMLDELGLQATLSWFFRRFQSIYTGINIEFDNDFKENDIPDSLKIIIYRILQEAMNNIAKHSKADLVNFSLRKSDNNLRLLIRDNGQGFDLEEVSSPERARSGLGLTSLRERIELSGGSFAIESKEGKGTVIRAVWPI